jgi:hypothetical protein
MQQVSPDQLRACVEYLIERDPPALVRDNQHNFTRVIKGQFVKNDTRTFQNGIRISSEFNNARFVNDEVNNSVLGENQTTGMNFVNDFRIEPSQTSPRYKFYESKLSENNNTNKLLEQFMGTNQFNGINFNQSKGGKRL